MSEKLRSHLSKVECLDNLLVIVDSNYFLSHLIKPGCGEISSSVFHLDSLGCLDESARQTYLADLRPVLGPAFALLKETGSLCEVQLDLNVPPNILEKHGFDAEVVREDLDRGLSVSFRVKNEYGRHETPYVFRCAAIGLKDSFLTENNLDEKAFRRASRAWHKELVAELAHLPYGLK